jgi:LysR family hydrogen peroxide-inducible transcriptional activator
VKLKEVQYFLAVCEEGSFTRAAKICGVAQPTLSMAIKRLERELGGILFARGTNDVSLSKLGKALRLYFKKLDDCAQRVYRKAAFLDL